MHTHENVCKSYVAFLHCLRLQLSLELYSLELQIFIGSGNRKIVICQISSFFRRKKIFWELLENHFWVGKRRKKKYLFCGWNFYLQGSLIVILGPFSLEWSWWFGFVRYSIFFWVRPQMHWLLQCNMHPKDLNGRHKKSYCSP